MAPIIPLLPGGGVFLALLFEKFVLKIEKRNSKLLKGLWQIASLLCINFGWVIFNSPNIKYGIKYCLGMVGYFGNRFSLNEEIIYLTREYGIYILMGILLATPVAETANQKIKECDCLFSIKSSVLPLGYILMFLWSISFLILGAHNPFIYFNF